MTRDGQDTIDRLVGRLIARLDLQPHPEGGYFRETYRAAHEVTADALPPGYSGPRALSTAIYFLLVGDQVSRLHRLRGDEVWHHHAGCGLTLHLFAAATGYVRRRLGPGPAGGGAAHQLPQIVVPAGSWFGATVDQEHSFALVGCTMAPGFDFADFELADRAALRKQYPDHVDVIERLGA